MMLNSQDWIKSPVDLGTAPAVFQKSISKKKEVKSAVLHVSAIGLFEVSFNGKKIGDAVLCPGYTHYAHRVQYMTYDLSSLFAAENTLAITVAEGWAVGRFAWKNDKHLYSDHYSLNAALVLTYADGSDERIVTDESWLVTTSHTTFASIYDGETVDMTAELTPLGHAHSDPDAAKFPLIPQEGEDIKEQERLAPAAILKTPAGETVIDFGQNMTGYVEITVTAKRGEKIEFSHGEVLDKDGNFYNANYRTAKNKITYICSGEKDVFKPRFSFQGFRYVRVDAFPEVPLDPDSIRAVAVHSEMRRIGRFVSGNEKINQLYHNTIWGQKSNYLDVPTDCPQRDERLGWTGDAQAFCRTAALNYDVRKFFTKWLHELRLDQREDGAVYGTCPENFGGKPGSRISAAWGDAATIIPYTLYEIYGDKQILADNFDMMKKWVDYQHATGPAEFLWLGGRHYGDWLAMDAGPDITEGATAEDLIASAFFYHSTELVVKAGRVLGYDIREYETLLTNIKTAFRDYFMADGMPKESFPITCYEGDGTTPKDRFRRGVTQTALILILHFGLCNEEERPALMAKLAELIADFDGRMTTGFVGSPYILHALSSGGRADLSYQLLFEERNPSWLYAVVHGATTIWEHWNSQKEDGSFWSTSMNSFNHYAYGSVCDWLYGVAAGIAISSDDHGNRYLALAPCPDKRLGFVQCSLETDGGVITSNWYYRGNTIHYEFTVPANMQASLLLPDGRRAQLSGGSYCFTTVSR